MLSARSILLCSLLVVAAVTIAPTSASAAECKKEAAKKFTLCLGEPLLLTEGTLTVRGETTGSSGYVLASSILSIKCKTGMSLGSLTSKTGGGVAVLGVVITFTECTTEAPHCRVKEPIQTRPVIGVPEAGEKERVLFMPQTGEAFTTITIEGNGMGTCLASARFQVGLHSGRGGILCTSPVELTRVVQLFTCHATELLLGEEPATFEGSYNAKVLSKTGAEEKWAVVEGK